MATVVDRPRPGVRLTDAEREHAASRLHAAHAEARISLDELDQRLAVVYRARVAGDLEPALRDLPTDRERALLSGEVEDGLVRLGPGEFVQRGRWAVPRRLVVDTVDVPAVLAQPVVSDLREAAVPHPRVDVELRTLHVAQLVLPAGASADVSGVRGHGSPRRTAVPTTPVPGRLHVVVRGVIPRRWMLWVDHRPAPLWWQLTRA
ncbi:DUF1707 SHOCT-like domain-containing protein [Pseudonocardia humida]|uniref:DUF1707 domain-containing protein n=1 Tax=Pseudonocardia humida TaxID=2800819 RepID=A0ABT1A4I5_9PSEU|nr:DUF1707 domain-containing protein [Pseudonocardia humida]MCO1657749.1 DUF1707 domain-containing protein [Pseudonocardia humida]